MAYRGGCDTLCLVARSPRRPRVSDIAAQSGLSRATVDRVLHGREGVRAGDGGPGRAGRRRARAAAHPGVAVRTDARCSTWSCRLRTGSRPPSRQALEAELASLRPAVLRSRAQLSEQSDPEAAAAILDRIADRGSDGVILKAPDHPLVAAAVARLAERGIPVVTFVTDLPASRRAAYVGVDNRAAGATAAYLVTSWARQRRSGAGDARAARRSTARRSARPGSGRRWPTWRRTRWSTR